MKITEGCTIEDWVGSYILNEIQCRKGIGDELESVDDDAYYELLRTVGGLACEAYEFYRKENDG